MGCTSGLMWLLLRLSCLLAIVRASGQIKGRVSIPHKYQDRLSPNGYYDILIIHISRIQCKLYCLLLQPFTINAMTISCYYSLFIILNILTMYYFLVLLQLFVLAISYDSYRHHLQRTAPEEATSAPGSGLAAARVILDGGLLQTLPASDGHFALNGVTPGPHLLQAKNGANKRYNNDDIDDNSNSDSKKQ